MMSKPRTCIAAATACAIAVVAVWSPAASPAKTSPPLWPGSRYTVADRDRAVERGLRFIYSSASDPQTFQEYGSDLMFAFLNISTSNGNGRIAALAREMGHERALEWRREHRRVPPAADAFALSDLIYGSYAARRLGTPDAAFDRALLAQARNFSPRDYLGFDPASEPPPDDYPGYSHRALFMYAMISTYFGEQFGTEAEGRYADVLHWLPRMRPYPPHRYGDWTYYDAVYALTHVVYTFNHYNLDKVSPACFPDEFAYLQANLSAAIADRDPETLGEYVDSFRAFGMDFSDTRLREAADYLLSTQNPDGSWGDPSDTDVYNRYHTTWTSQGALQEFHWKEPKPCPAN